MYDIITFNIEVITSIANELSAKVLGFLYYQEFGTFF